MNHFDRYSVEPGDDMLALGGFPAVLRHDPTGHEDCAREWDPCECHGDRLCQLGKLMRWWRMDRLQRQWLTDEEIPRLETLLASSDPIPWGRSFFGDVEQPMPTEDEKRRRLTDRLREAQLQVRQGPKLDARWASEIHWKMRAEAGGWRRRAIRTYEQADAASGGRDE